MNNDEKAGSKRWSVKPLRSILLNLVNVAHLGGENECSIPLLLISTLTLGDVFFTNILMRAAILCCVACCLATLFRKLPAYVTAVGTPTASGRVYTVSLRSDLLKTPHIQYSFSV